MRNNPSTRPDLHRYLRTEAEKLHLGPVDFGGTLVVQIGGGSEDWLGRAIYARHVRIGGDCPEASLRARAEALPLGEGEADLVLLIHVLANVEQASVVLAEATRVLRGEGRLIVVERRLPRSLSEWRAGSGGGLIHCGRLRRLAASAGLTWQGSVNPSRSRLHRGCTHLGMGTYAALAIKRVQGPHLLRPRWKTRRPHRQTVLQEHGQCRLRFTPTGPASATPAPEAGRRSSRAGSIGGS